MKSSRKSDGADKVPHLSSFWDGIDSKGVMAHSNSVEGDWRGVEAL